MAGHLPPQPNACGIAVIADRHGRASRELLQRGLDALRRLSHRNRRKPASPSTLGAGVLTAIPWDLFAPQLPAALRDPGTHRIAAMFALESAQADRAILAARSALGRLGWHVMAWRDVPTVLDMLEPEGRASAPRIVQCFACAPRYRQKRTPYRTRLAIEARWLRLGLARCSVTSLSDCTIVYKGLLDPLAIDRFFPDLADPRYASPVALVHSGFNANTWHRWELAQPFHAIAHVGEIHTISGNRLWMDARIGDAGIRDESDLLKAAGSDSQTLDAAVQWLRETGLSTPHALARLVPPAWSDGDQASMDARAFLRHEACFAEPWDGPAAIAFADGRRAGALLDRTCSIAMHSLETRDLVCLASEPDALEPPPYVTHRGEIRAGEMLVVDQESGTVLRGEAAGGALAANNDYVAAASRLIHRFAQISPDGDAISGVGHLPGERPEQERPLTRWFRHRFAPGRTPEHAQEQPQTVCLRTLLGRRGQWSSHGLPAVLLELDSPILLPHELEALLDQCHVRAAMLPIGFDPDAAMPAAGLRKGIADLQRTATALAANGTRILVLSDRSLEPGQMPIPSVLATAAVDEGLRSARLRLRASIVADAADINDAHDVAILAGFGAGAIVGSRRILEAGVRDILWRAGASSFEAYCGARLFYAIGMDSSLIRYFAHVASLPGALSLDDVAAEASVWSGRRWAAEALSVRT